MYVCLSSCRIAIFGKHHAHMCHITNLIVSSSISSAILRSNERIFFRSLVAGGGRWGHFYVRFRAHIKHIYLDFQMFPQLVSISLSLSVSHSPSIFGELLLSILNWRQESKRCWKWMRRNTMQSPYTHTHWISIIVTITAATTTLCPFLAHKNTTFDWIVSGKWSKNKELQKRNKNKTQEIILKILNACTCRMCVRRR